MKINNYIKEIEGKRIIIVPVKIKDAEVYFRKFNYEVTKYQFAEPFKTIKEAENLIINFIELSYENISCMFTIRNKMNEFIGGVEVYNLYSEYPEVGIWISKENRNKGYAEETLKYLKRYLKENYNTKGLVYEADIRNKPSLKLIKKFNAEKIEYNEVTDMGKTLKLEKYLIL